MHLNNNSFNLVFTNILTRLTQLVSELTDMWMVRAGKDAFLIDEFKDKNIVAIGWGLGDLSDKSRNDIEVLVNKLYPNHTKNQNAKIISQESKFRFDIKTNDYVLSYNPSTRQYLLGKITSDYIFSDIISKNLDEGDFSDVRHVEWLGEISRDKLKVSTKNTLGAISTLFSINEDAQKDILNVFNGVTVTPEGSDESEGDDEVSILMDEIEDKSKEFIKDIVNSLDWDEMQELVAGLLRAMGYKTIVSSPGSDRGKDIIASPDGLGLEDPVILVEVKHRNTSMSSPDIRSFKGALKKNNKGIYVSTGGFTTDAKYEAERSEIPIILMDLDSLVKFILQYYDNFDGDARSLIPLKKIYWPIK